MVVVRLPVAALDVVVRSPVGDDDLLLLEAGPPDLQLALALLARLAVSRDGDPLDVAALPIVDVDVLLLGLRRLAFGDVIRTDVRCPACHARADIAFSIVDYLVHHAPGALPAGVTAAGGGWYRIAGVEVRVPCAVDQLAIAHEEQPERALLVRCLRSEGIVVSDAVGAQIDEALEVIAPSLCDELDGVCPACATGVEVTFDPLDFTLRELRDRAAGVYEDVAWIAHHFHWSEAEILALPAARRTRYAELAASHARERRAG